MGHLRDLKPKTILDVATGTADFAIAALRLDPVSVIGIDIADRMLEVGREKLRRADLDGKIDLRTGAAEGMAFPDGTFDATIVAFGARNFEQLDLGLAEMHRVLRPGGKIVVLEFSRPGTFPVRQLYFAYFQHILPLIGRVVSKSSTAYRYLPDTVMRFPEGDDFLRILSHLGFRETVQERLTFGITTIYSGIKTH